MGRSYKAPIDKSKGRKLKTPVYNRNTRKQIRTKMNNIDEDYIDEEEMDDDEDLWEEDFDDEDEEEEEDDQ